MTLQVVGAGLGRTGTHSLKLALEHLLGKPCYHMAAVMDRDEDVPVWQAAFEGDPPDWRAFFDGWGAVVDWPAAAFAVEIADAFPDALVLHSVRDADAWWASADATIFTGVRGAPAEVVEAHPRLKMVKTMFASTFTSDLGDADAAKAAFDAHNARIRAVVPAERRLEWRPGDGWEPICDRLGLAVPAEPFPRSNSTEDFTAAVSEGRRPV